MWWKTIIVIFGTLLAVIGWGFLSVVILPGDSDIITIARIALSIFVGVVIGKIAAAVWEVWTDNYV